MSSQPTTSGHRDLPGDTISRRRLLAVGGALGVGSLAGCLNRVASAVTTTTASPAAVFAGRRAERIGDFVLGDPHVARLTATWENRVELEGWATSTAVMAQDYNSSRSNKPSTVAGGDDDSDGDGILDPEEMDELLTYLGGEPVIGERFSVCLPDAAVPGRSESIRTQLTPERFLSYITGDVRIEGKDVLIDGVPLVFDIAAAADTAGDTGCTVAEVTGELVCWSPHLSAATSAPTPTGGGLASAGSGGHVTVVNTPPSVGSGPSVLVCPLNEAAFEPENLRSWGSEAGMSSETPTIVCQLLVQPPECPHPFPALLYVKRCLSDNQLVYTGGWVVDDAALYEDSVTVLSMGGETLVVPVAVGDLDGDGLEDVVERAARPTRGRVRYNARGAQFDSGPLLELAEDGTLPVEDFDPDDPDGNEVVQFLSENGFGTRKATVTKEPEELLLLHAPVDAPILHLTNAARLSNEVKFKAGAELSKAAS